MNNITALEQNSRDLTLLAWCIMGSVAAHGLVMAILPAWQAAKETPPLPLTVALLKPPPEIEPPKLPEPLPIETRPVPPERAKPVPVKPVAREERPVEQPRAAPLLTAPPEALAAPVVAVAPEQKPAPPPEPPRPQAAAPVPPAPVTPPRSDAAYLNNPRPAYPLAARRRGDQGTVLIRVLVTTEGLAAGVSLEKTSGHPALDESALSAVKSWRFVPARQGGQAIESPYVVPIVFKVE